MEHAILDTESRRNAAFSSVRKQPPRADLRGPRGLLTTIRRSERAPLYRPVGRLVNRISAAANACHDFVRMEPVANPDFRTDLWRGPDLHRPDSLPAMLKKYHA